tara:strand:- start:1693 stop:1938 length:246 start_codon:yes stop_codon:yes gene_type:complete
VRLYIATAIATAISARQGAALPVSATSAIFATSAISALAASAAALAALAASAASASVAAASSPPGRLLLRQRPSVHGVLRK